MKSLKRIFLVICILITGFAAAPASRARAEAIKLTPGDYAGRFYYTVDWIKVDKQTHGDLTSDLNYIGNFYIEGLVTLRVGMNGKILPGVKISPNSTTAYELYYYKVTPGDCNIRSYLSVDASSTIKFKSTGTSESFITTIKLDNIRPMHFEKKDSGSKCSGFGSQKMLTQWVNELKQFVNKTKNLTFVVMKASKNDLIGSILLEGVPVKTNTPGGYTLIKDEGRFELYKIDPLAPLDDDSLAPLVEDPLVPLGEWRTK